MPPAAIIGTSVRARIPCSSTSVETSSGFLKPPPSAPSDHQAVDAGLDAFHRGLHRRHRMIDDDACGLQRRNEFRRAAGRGGDEFNARVADELKHCIVAQESNWQVDTERQVQRFHLVDLGLTGLGFARRGLDDAEAAGA
jgi:hypothetical protein